MLELRPGLLGDELAELAGEGVQSFLLEGGPTLATAFLEQRLIDKLVLFLAPTISGSGPPFLGQLEVPLDLLHIETRRVEADVVVEGYFREP